MKIRAFVAAAALLASMTGSAFAACDIKDEDKQGVCVDKCFFEYVAVKNRFATSAAGVDKAKADKDACYTKCGCEPSAVKE